MIRITVTAYDETLGEFYADTLPASLLAQVAERVASKRPLQSIVAKRVYEWAIHYGRIWPAPGGKYSIDVVIMAEDLGSEE